MGTAVADYHWEHLRQTTESRGITLSVVETAYPSKSAQISDRPDYDAGGNFGRFARTSLMDDYIATLRNEEIVGIPIWAWQRFLGMFSQDWREENVTSALRALERLAEQQNDPVTAGQLAAVRDKLVEITEMVSGSGDHD